MDDLSQKKYSYLYQNKSLWPTDFCDKNVLIDKLIKKGYIFVPYE